MKTFTYTRFDGMIIEVRLDPGRPKGISRLQRRGIDNNGKPWIPDIWYPVTDEARVNMNHDCPEILQQLQAMAERDDSPAKSIREAIIARTDYLGLTPLGIHMDINAANLKEVSMNHIVSYLAGTSDMTGERLDSVLHVLGLTVKPE